MPNEWDSPPEPEDDAIAPGDPDYDLSEAHGYSWETERRGFWPPPPPVVVILSLLLAASLLLPTLLFIASR